VEASEYFKLIQKIVMSDEFRVAEIRKTSLPAILCSIEKNLENSSQGFNLIGLTDLGNCIILLLKV